VLTTNLDASTTSPGLTKHIARCVQRGIGTAQHSACLRCLIRQVRGMGPEVDAESEHFPAMLP
jgi:hypothetical protein